MASTTRRLAAILAADIAGYSRLMGADEVGTAQALREHRSAADPLIAQHGGRIVKTTGDGLLIEFGSVVGAVECALGLQRLAAERNAGTPAERRMEWRIGVHLGDVLIEGDDILGDGVNIAARLEGIAEPGGICLSEDAFRQVRGKVEVEFADLGERQLKNIARPVRVYALGANAAAPIRTARARRLLSPQRAVVSAALVAVIGVTSAVWWAWPRPSVPAAAMPTVSPPSPGGLVGAPIPRLSIVVLPLASLSNDPDQEYFADGITDDLTTDLSRISGSFVIARNTAFTYRGKPVDAKQIGHELGVRYVLEGSVRRAGDQVRVNVQLIDAETGAHLWADRFDTDRANLPEAQNEITARLARALNVELVRDASRRIEQQTAVDPDARDLVMRGWAAWWQPRSLASTQAAQRSFAQALTLDPSSVDAKIGLATVLAVSVGNGLSSSVSQDQTRAEQLLLEAVDRDPDRSMARYAIAALRQSQNRLAEARIEAEKAVALDPNFAGAHQILGSTLLFMGQPEAAIPQIEKALRLSPHDPSVYGFSFLLGACELVLGRIDDAVDFFRKARAANSRVWFVHLWLAAALGLKGDLDEAKAALAESLRLNPGINSLAHWRAQFSYFTNPALWPLLEKTFVVGLRRAGFPDE
jgi:TolB-like protein/class 3 adenylate cyclase/Tfp pilus assembly protein PilF